MRTERLENIAEIIKSRTPVKGVHDYSIDRLGPRDAAFRAWKGEPATIAKVNDILVSLHRADIGAASIVDTEGPVPGHLLVVRPGEQLRPTSLFHALNHHLYQNSRLRNLTRDVLAQLTLLLPSMAEQRQIADRLQLAHGIIQKRAQGLQMLEALAQSSYLDQFGDGGAHPRARKRVRFKELARVDLREATARKSGKEETLIVTQDSLDPANIGIRATPGPIGSEKTPGYIFTPQHVLVSSLRTPNKVALPDFSGTCSATIFPVLPLAGRANREFICAALRSPHFGSYVSGLPSKSIGSINIKALEDYTIIAAPMEEQEAFAKTFALIQAAIIRFQQSHEQSRALLESLYSAAFSGQLEMIPTVHEHIDMGLPLLKDVAPVKPPVFRKKGSTPPPDDWQKLADLYSYLEPKLQPFQKGHEVKSSIKDLKSFVRRAAAKNTDKIKAAAQGAKLPGTEVLAELEALKQWFEEYKVRSHTDQQGNFPIDHSRQEWSNLRNCHTSLEKMLGNRFFTFSGRTEALGKAVPSSLEAELAASERGHEEELKRAEGRDLLSTLARDHGGFRQLMASDIDRGIMRCIDEIRLDNFTIGELREKLEEDMSFYGKHGEVTAAAVTDGVYRFIDSFLLAEMANQPFTFAQMRDALQAIGFTPVFEVVNNYIFQRLDEGIFLKQAYFDEQMSAVNTGAYEYLMDTMNTALMGQNTFTPPRRLFLVYSLPQTAALHATEKN